MFKPKERTWEDDMETCCDECCPSLSWEKRMMGAAVCLVVGLPILPQRTLPGHTNPSAFSFLHF